jgi:hypothetical protein
MSKSKTAEPAAVDDLAPWIVYRDTMVGCEEVISGRGTGELVRAALARNGGAYWTGTLLTALALAEAENGDWNSNAIDYVKRIKQLAELYGWETVVCRADSITENGDLLLELWDEEQAAIGSLAQGTIAFEFMSSEEEVKETVLQLRSRRHTAAYEVREHALCFDWHADIELDEVE